ncbi:MAG: TRAP transporter small permease subunit [Acidimicrobiia bacterium]|nr:TRAP transporter small permease subunit [Acidimicrobiia bacterium]MYA38716.1 TRAP transporter small permease subunit [Acidimicrobiia bacterium]MYB77864.1 TRAP transporter small permease subunit [Acidimicrobiia bacterium]MYG91321.1 TRAP transporter small permease subunit [Acidimicrobiia bacterium]MYK55428.1 TRAP transporter small permease subunit [Acidimicrobiia bacterium]
MSSAAGLISKGSRSTISVLRLLLAVLLGGLSLLMFVQVVMRYVFNSSIVWSEEVPRIMLIWLVFVGLATTMKGKHLIIDVVRERRWIAVVSIVFKWAMLIFFVYYGTVLATKVSGQTMPITKISRSWQYAAAPVGAALALILGVDEIVDLFRSPDSEQPSSPAPAEA